MRISNFAYGGLETLGAFKGGGPHPRTGAGIVTSIARYKSILFTKQQDPNKKPRHFKIVLFTMLVDRPTKP